VKFVQETQCSCGGVFPFATYGEAEWPTVVCTKCGMAGAQFNPLSVSVTAERLLFRSKQELEGGDFTLSIVIGAMAVESFLTQLFFKVKGMDNYALTFTWPTEAQEKAWENEYPRKGGFAGPADFVAKATTSMTFDEFVGMPLRNRLWQDSRTQRAFLQNNTSKVGFFIRVIELLTGAT